MSNICTACQHQYTGHRSCPACGNHQYVNADRHAGMRVRGPQTHGRREELKACGLRWDEDYREWFVPEGLTAEQADRVDALLADRRGLECGYYTRD